MLGMVGNTRVCRVRSKYIRYIRKNLGLPIVRAHASLCSEINMEIASQYRWNVHSDGISLDQPSSLVFRTRPCGLRYTAPLLEPWIAREGWRTYLLSQGCQSLLLGMRINVCANHKGHNVEEWHPSLLG